MGDEAGFSLSGKVNYLNVLKETRQSFTTIGTTVEQNSLSGSDCVGTVES